MKNHRFLLSISILSATFFWLLNGCSSLNTVRVAGTNFTDEIQLSQNLVFTFSKDLVQESRLGIWDSTQYVRLQPAVRGKFKWTAPNELVFSPIGAFDPATTYKAELTDELLNHLPEDKKYTISDEDLAFHTPYLQLTDLQSWWTRSAENSRPEARLRLTFNYPVDPQAVTELLQVRLRDTQTSFRVLPSSEGRYVTVALTQTGTADENAAPLAVRIEKGLKMKNKEYATPQPLETVASLPSPLHLEIADVQTGFENNQGYVRVYTTQELTPEAVENGFSLEPVPGKLVTETTENGFIVRGDFNETDTYVLKVTTALKGVLGPQLDEEVSRDLFFGKMPPGITFTHKKALYLTSKGSRNMGVQIVNVPKVQVKIAKIYENNILNYVRNSRYENYDYVGDEWQATGSYNYSDDDQSFYSDVVVNKTVDTENLPRTRGISALNVALPDDNGRKGVYLVSVISKEEAYLGSTRLVSVSDIGLIAKEGKDEVWVFANSIKTTEPLSKVSVTLVSSNNQSVYTLETDNNGMAHFEKLSEKAPGFRMAMVTARTDDDFNYLLLNDTQVETSRYEVEGLRDNPTGLQAFIYGERDMYRPGETLHFNTVVRSQGWQTASEIPLKIKMLTPNGREYRTWRKTTNAQGAVETEVTVDAAGLTGTYTLEVYNGNDVLLASQGVSVEEFMPDRIKVDLSGAKKEYKTGETVALTATALNLFGPPAANRTYEMDIQWKRKAFSAPDFPDFSFDIPAETTFEREQRQGLTNEQGVATERIQIPSGYKDIGVLEGKIYVTIFDENGRPVNRLHRFDVLTQATLYGIRLPDRYVGVNAPVPVEIIGVNGQGILQKNSKAQVEVVRVEYQTVVEKQNEQLRYTSRRREKSVYSNTLSLGGGRGSFRYVPTVSGEYEVRVRRPGASHFTATTFFAYGAGFTEYSSFEVSNEGRVLMEPDQERYQVGDKARILFKTPFDGRLLVTVERNQVLEHHVLTTEKKAAEFTFSIQQEHLPNVYITATLIRPLDASDLPLTVAHGFAPLRIEALDRALPVAIKAVEQSRSKQKQRISIQTKPNAQLTLSVVDEGILQIKNFRTPDIHGYFYQKRALEVGSYDLYAFLFPELTFSSTSSSGGDGYDLERRINPLSNGRTELVTFWSGILTANSSGVATFDVAIPQFSGDLRIMAVAYKDNAFGSASHNMKVADPVVISTGAPRFLSPNDELTLPVTISNMEKKATTVNVSLSTTGPLSATGPTQKLTIPAGKEARTVFSVKAGARLGAGTITVKVGAFGETFVQQTNLSVRPASPLLKTSNAGVIAGGQAGTINLAHNFISGTARSQVVVSRSPMVQSGGKALATLLGYPFGCLEQSISRAFPQIYFADLTKAMATPVYLVKSGASDFNPATNVQQAIRKAESQQLYNGGLALWPGASREDWWTTAYTVHFLEEARRAGFEVNAATMSRAMDYLINKTGTTATEEVPQMTEDGSTVRTIQAQRESLYSLYVLALTGRPNRSAMNYYKQHPELLANDTRYLLAGAFQLMGDSRSFEALLPKKYEQESVENSFGGSYSSPLRNLALVLNTLLETSPDHIQIPSLARQLSQALASSSYLNTQEAGFAVLALGKLAQRTSGSTVTATLNAKGKKLASFDGTELNLSEGISNQKLSVQTQGKGDLYWFAQTEGMSATGAYTEEDQGLRVRRQYLTRTGGNAGTIKQNDLLVVKISVSSTNGLPVENVVVTDLLPAGFEIENPRLTEPRDMPWIKNAATPEYFDIRDDRIHFFTTATGKEQTFYYQVRVISKGTFTVGPVAADAMYQGEYRSYAGGGKVTVQ
ncbi:alpha-2-macroglobulin family protein [Arundinibacter roseus]|uniref:Alpha-2-macroglobulin family protein n=1 Tax=Arundinibacter roseus TaxID=2070510 RepID=A0A4R4K0X2_9BACT|nr:MG2 domain-containing protein [Arundinibacter roseus]TDB60858.1 alpha-2-macroglobulin family protein [Arundinibacter roseus]